MKLKSIKILSTFAAVLALTMVGCSGDDNSPDQGPVLPDATCSDGVKNGDETGVDCGGSCNDACEVATEGTELSGSQSEDKTLDATKTYSLKGTYSIESGATLTIQAGTKIVSDKGTDFYIVVQKGGKIDVQGTAAAPVIMTSANETPGDWGGLVIAGNATTTEGVDATAEVGGIIYGGSDDADDSGSISYLIINYAGAQINSESQYNGLTLYAVGSGTTIENVAILNGTDDGVEFFGGTVSASNFYLEDNEDDAVDWTEGWTGTLTNTYVLHENAGFSTAIEADGVDAAVGVPTIANFTAVSSVDGTALQFKKTTGATMTNVSLSGYATNVDMKDGGPVGNIMVDGTALTSVNDDVFTGTVVDITMFDWATGN